MDLTLIIIIVTAVISVWCFNDRRIFDLLSLVPYRTTHQKEWWRVITHGFVHADYMHLIINMLVFYSFGAAVEGIFGTYTASHSLHFSTLYFGGMVVASISSVVKYRNNYNYCSVGASGAVAAVLFAYVFFLPWNKLLIMGIIPVPGIIFAFIYLIYSMYMSKRGGDNINHDAHFYGAAFGFLYPLLIDPSLARVFFYNLLHP